MFVPGFFNDIGFNFYFPRIFYPFSYEIYEFPQGFLQLFPHFPGFSAVFPPPTLCFARLGRSCHRTRRPPWVFARQWRSQRIEEDLGGGGEVVGSLMAVGQNPRYLFGDYYPPKVVYFKG